MNPEKYPKDYKGPMSGISEAKEWRSVRGIDAFKWIQDGTWTYCDFDNWFNSRDAFYWKWGEKNILNALEEFHKTMKVKNKIKQWEACADNLIDYAHDFVAHLSLWGKGYDRNDKQIKLAEDAIEQYNRLKKS